MDIRWVASADASQVVEMVAVRKFGLTKKELSALPCVEKVLFLSSRLHPLRSPSLPLLFPLAELMPHSFLLLSLFGDFI